MIPRTALAVLALSALALAACGSDDSPAADDSLPAVGAAPTADDLADLSFESTEVTGHELVADTTIELAFTSDSLSARAGCNSMNGGYSITDGALEVGDAMASTMMACSDDLMAQDTWLSSFLSSGPAIALDGDTLTLTGDDATITFNSIQPTELEGTTWTVTGIVANDAVSSLPMGAEASITITDGQAAIRTGCNSGSTSVEITDATITFGPIALTKMACADEEVNQLETHMLAVLAGEVAYEISADSLSLLNEAGDGRPGLELSAG
jgi:heat shock protein HslJ